MNNILPTGLLAGLMALIGTAILIEKLSISLRRFVFRHHLITDVTFTLVGIMVLPVAGIATLITSLTYMILFSLYLSRRRRKYLQDI